MPDRNHRRRVTRDDCSQAGDRYHLRDDDARNRLAGNIVATVQGVSEHIQKRRIAHFLKADPAYGVSVAKGLGIKVK